MEHVKGIKGKLSTLVTGIHTLSPSTKKAPVKATKRLATKSVPVKAK